MYTYAYIYYVLCRYIQTPPWVLFPVFFYSINGTEARKASQMGKVTSQEQMRQSMLEWPK